MSDRCHACGKTSCVGKNDPVGGPYTLHNAAAYADLLERRATEGPAEEETS